MVTLALAASIISVPVNFELKIGEPSKLEVASMIKQVQKFRTSAMTLKWGSMKTPPVVAGGSRKELVNEVKKVRAAAKQDADVESFSNAESQVGIKSVVRSGDTLEVKYSVENTFFRSKKWIDLGAPGSLKSVSSRTAFLLYSSAGWKMTRDVPGDSVSRMSSSSPATSVPDVMEMAGKGSVPLPNDQLARPGDDVKDAGVVRT